MRITSIEPIPLRYTLPPEQAYGMARGLVGERVCTLVRVRVDEGLEGIGEAWGPPAIVVPHVEALRDVFFQQDPYDLEVVIQRWLNVTYHQGYAGLRFAALSGVELALWDLMGKAAGLPVSKLLGGTARTQVRAYASDGFFTAGQDDFGDQVARSLEGGFDAIKIKIGRGIDDDVRRVETVRNVGGDCLLMVDMNATYTADAAIASLIAVREYGIHWVEEPVSPLDRSGLRVVRSAVPDIPIAAGEAEYLRYGFRGLIAERLVDIVQPDVAKCGGLLEAKEIARMALTENIRVSPHSWSGAVSLAATLQLLASIPDSPHTTAAPFPLFFELDRTDNPLRDELLTEPIRAHDGWVSIPDGPGLGITLDEDAVARYRIH